MKLTYLSAAVTTAIAMTLTGCGGSDDNDVSYTPVTTTPTPTTTTPATSSTGTTPTPSTGTTPTPTTGEGTGGLTSNTLVNGIETKTTSSVVGQSYNRNKGSNFDYYANKNASNTSSPVALGGKTLQDPDMKNIVLGQEVKTVVDAAGNTVTATDGSAQNFTVKRYAGFIAGQPTAAETFATKKLDGTAGSITVKPETLQVENAKNTKLATATNIYRDATQANADALYNSGLTLNGSNSSVFVSNSGVQTGLENAGDKTTARVFGAKFLDTANAATLNTYRAPLVDASGKAVVFDKASQFQAAKLDNVQYGRVSSNVDVLANTSTLDGTRQYVGTQFVERNADDAVNTYFYRGNNESTIAQMNALPSDAKYQYYGHALTYGVGTDTTKAQGATNSVGDSQTKSTLGNFVGAEFDNKAKTLVGNIYNVGYTTGSNGTTASNVNKLVSFNGNVVGNTVNGTAVNNTVTTNANGALKASFFGDKAQELGGSVNSLSSDAYGTSAWGGVFGAKRDIIAPPAVTTNGQNIFTPE